MRISVFVVTFALTFKSIIEAKKLLNGRGIDFAHIFGKRGQLSNALPRIGEFSSSLKTLPYASVKEQMNRPDELGLLFNIISGRQTPYDRETSREAYWMDDLSRGFIQEPVEPFQMDYRLPEFEEMGDESRRILMMNNDYN